MPADNEKRETITFILGGLAGGGLVMMVRNIQLTVWRKNFENGSNTLTLHSSGTPIGAP
jgi:hypothetical protein